MLVVFCPSLVVDHIEMYELLQPFVELSKPILLAQAAQLSAHALRSRVPAADISFRGLMLQPACLQGC